MTRSSEGDIGGGGVGGGEKDEVGEDDIIGE